MKVRIKDVPNGWECSYLTVGKEYECKTSKEGKGGSIINDDGVKNYIFFDSSSHLDYGSWEVIPDGDAAEERMESMMLHGTEG